MEQFEKIKSKLWDDKNGIKLFTCGTYMIGKPDGEMQNVKENMLRFPLILDILEKEKEILKVQAINEGKPEAIAEKMVQGRIKKFYKENCLMDQEFIKDGDQTIKSYTEAKAKELGGKIEILSFVRYEKGEGIEKRNDDFASEVASMMK